MEKFKKWIMNRCWGEKKSNFDTELTNSRKGMKGLTGEAMFFLSFMSS
jgi:hypothetical protein